jgi:hypothetical protein
LRRDFVSGARIAQAISSKGHDKKADWVNRLAGAHRKNLDSQLLGSTAGGRTSASVIGGFFARQDFLLKRDAMIGSGTVRRC